jgi:hypothetical protein
MGKSALDATQNCMQKIAPATHNLIQFCVCKRYFCCLVAFTYSKKCVCVFLWRITFELGIDGTAAGILLWCVVPSLYIYISYILPHRGLYSIILFDQERIHFSGLVTVLPHITDVVAN